jgi:hypothetical protein
VPSRLHDAGKIPQAVFRCRRLRLVSRRKEAASIDFANSPCSAPDRRRGPKPRPWRSITSYAAKANVTA